MDLESLFSIVIRRKWVILGAAVMTALLVFLLGRMLSSYEAVGALLIRPVGLQPPAPGVTRQSLAAEIIQPSIGMVTAPQISLLVEYGNTFLKILTSHRLISETVTQLELDKAYAQNGRPSTLEMLKQPIRFLIHGQLPAKEKSPLEQAVEDIARGISASLLFKTSIIELRVQSDTAPKATDIANTLMTLFVEYSKTQNTSHAERAAKFVREQIDFTHTELTRQRQRLTSLKETYRVGKFSDFTKEIARIVKKLDLLEEDYEKYKYKVALLKDKVTRLNKEVNDYQEHKAFSSTTTIDGDLPELEKKLLELQVQLQTALFDYAPNSPQVTSLKAPIALLEKAIVAAAERPLNLIQEYRTRLEELGEGAEQEFQIDVAITSLEEQERELQNNLDMIKLLSVKGLSEVQILDRALIPRYPTIRELPLLVYVMVGFLSGLGMGVVGVVLQDQWRSANSRDAEEASSDLS